MAATELGSSAKRWGTNWIDEAVVLRRRQRRCRVAAGRIRNDWAQTRYQARAAGGDSGGGVFFKRDNESRWELAGIMQSVSTHLGQPGSVAVYGDLTNIANLTLYRSQILEIMHGGELGVWQNPGDPMDVNSDRIIAPLDVC